MISEKMNIKEFRDLQNKVGYTNLKEGIKKQIYGDMKEKKKEDEKQTKIEIKEADKMIK